MRRRGLGAAKLRAHALSGFAGLLVAGCLLPSVSFDPGAEQEPTPAPPAGDSPGEGEGAMLATDVTLPEPPEPSCNDDVQNQNESDRDCGGVCAPCGSGRQCASERDCALGLRCSVQTLTCVSPECDNERVDGDEVAIDCGGGTCPGCPDGTPCNDARDCAGAVCEGNLCSSPSCMDSVMNQDETGVDCGGSCAPCALDGPCADGVVNEASCYLQVDTPLSWSDARASCQSWGGDLVTITTPDENTFLTGLLVAEVWIGATDVASEGSFVWVDASPLVFSNFGADEPNGGAGSDCLYQSPVDGAWHDSDCSQLRLAICEK